MDLIRNLFLMFSVLQLIPGNSLDLMNPNKDMIASNKVKSIPNKDMINPNKDLINANKDNNNKVPITNYIEHNMTDKSGLNSYCKYKIDKTIKTICHFGKCLPFKFTKLILECNNGKMKRK